MNTMTLSGGVAVDIDRPEPVREFRVKTVRRYIVTDWSDYRGGSVREIAECANVEQANEIAETYGDRHPGSLVNTIDAASVAALEARLAIVASADPDKAFDQWWAHFPPPHLFETQMRTAFVAGFSSHASSMAGAEKGLTAAQVKHMADRFLNWSLPDPWRPDGGISFEPVVNKGTPHEHVRRPVGTNLFDFTQATAMVRHMIEGLPPT